MASTSKRKQSVDTKKNVKRAKKNSLAKKRALEQSFRDKYPRFIFENYDKDVVSEEFVLAVKSELRNFDFEDSSCVSSGDRKYFKMFKKFGFNNAVAMLRDHISEKNRNVFNTYYQLHIGSWVYKQLREKGILQKFLPISDCQIAIYQDCVVKFFSLLTAKTPWGKAYYSTKKPEVQIGSDKYIVSFSQHSLERIAERTVLDWLNYGGAGSVFAFINHCTFYEFCTLEHNGSTVPAITFYDTCVKGFENYRYVEELVEDPGDNVAYYYRVGYCPVGLYNNYARAITLLTPGMKGTPESLLVNKVENPVERQKIQEGVQNITSFKTLYATKDFSAVKWFHANGVPQLITSPTPLYDYS